MGCPGDCASTNVCRRLAITADIYHTNTATAPLSVVWRADTASVRFTRRQSARSVGWRVGLGVFRMSNTAVRTSPRRLTLTSSTVWSSREILSDTSGTHVCKTSGSLINGCTTTEQLRRSITTTSADGHLRGYSSKSSTTYRTLSTSRSVLTQVLCLRTDDRWCRLHRTVQQTE